MLEQATTTQTGRRRDEIVLVDDDDTFRDVLRANLSDAGFEVHAFDRAPPAFDHLRARRSTRLALLDWKMPGMNGIELMHRLREAGSDVPVIFLTVLGEPFYEETALADGAVDFIDKSRTFAIIQKRIEMITRGGPVPADGNDASAVAIGRLRLFPESCRATWDGTRIELTIAEYAIVAHLAGRRGEDIRYREIYDAVRGPGFSAGHGADGYRANVRAFVRRIRQKFCDLDPAFDNIVNYPGFGYRWVDGEPD